MRTSSLSYIAMWNASKHRQLGAQPTKEMVKRLASIRPRHALTIVCLLPRAEASSNLRRHSFCCRFEEEERGRGGGESLARGVRKLTAATRGARAPEPVGAEQLGEGVLTLPPLRSLPPPPPPPGKEWYCTQHLRHLRQLRLRRHRHLHRHLHCHGHHRRRHHFHASTAGDARLRAPHHPAPPARRGRVRVS